MSDGLSRPDRRQELISVIRRVRNRWRTRLALRGAVIVVAGTLVALLLSASSLEALRFSSTAIVAFRIAALFVFAVLVGYALVLPLRRRVTDSQVALYLEECDPSLQAAILSAVETSAIAADDSPTGPSPHLVDKLVEQAIAQCQAAEPSMGVERAKMKRHAFTLAGMIAAAVLLVVLGPAYLRHGLSALVVVWGSAEAASPYHIDVKPGNAKIPKGQDLAVTATLSGFNAPEATLLVSLAPGAPFERVPLVPGKQPGTFEGLVFHLEKSSEYYVESNGVKSGTYKLEVVELPTVDKLVMEYNFPAYTGLAPRSVDPGGDVAAVQGTQVKLTITPTMPTSGGRLKLNDTESLPLSAQEDGTLAGNFKVGGQGFYRIELDGPHGENVPASPQYTIDVLSDQEPSISFSKPGRDSTASPVEEVFAEVRADDDFGVKQVQMFYSVNGGAEKTVNLFGGGGARPLPEVTASHTIYLEELGLSPGDFVSYYAKANDNDGVTGTKTATSDIYFIQIRPFRKDYKAAQSAGMMGGGAGGGGQGDQVNQLSRQQQQIIAATFNIERDRRKMTKAKIEESANLVKLNQEKLRGQVQELSDKMNSRLDVVDPALKTIAEALPKAAAEMKQAEANLLKADTKEALKPEQRALKLLQDAEMQYEVQVAMSQGGGGGGGGGQMSQDLADLFELELDKLANQYEMQQRAQQEESDRTVDELVDRLNELARRQQQEAERQRALSAGRQQSGSGGGGGAGGGDSQRQLAQQLEELARQLEQLQREEPKQNLSQALRDLRQAQESMRQAAANGGAGDGGAQAAQALDALKRAQQRLQQQEQGGRIDRDLADARRRAEGLAGEQKDLVNEINRLDQAGAGRQGKVDGIMDRKSSMSAEVTSLKDQIEKMANQARREQRETARKLDEAAGAIGDKRVKETIDWTRRVLGTGNGAQQAKQYETGISNALDELVKKLGEAQAAMGQAAKQDATERAAEAARNAARRGESLDQRLRENPGKQDKQNSQGSPGSQSAQGSKGSEGSQGSQSSQGSPQDGQNAGGSQDGRADGQQAGGADGANRDGGYNGGAWGGGPWRDGGYWGGWTPDQIRQFRPDFDAWRGDIRDLQRRLREAGVQRPDMRNIEDVLRKLDDNRVFADPRNLQALMESANQMLKQMEFDLRKKLEGGDQPISLSASDEVPAGFRQNIEEYFRSLAKKQ